MAKVIGIAGGSGSGKTLVSSTLSSLLEDAAVISLDFYYKDQSHLSPEERSYLNYDAPEVLDHELFFKHLEELKKGHEVRVPQYDFSTHTRKKETLLIKPRPYIIAEGILLYHFKESDRLIDYKIYVEADGDVRLARRLLRDEKERGREPFGIIRQFLASVRPMHTLYVQPTIDKADAILVNNNNNGIQKEELYPLLERIKDVQDR